jgi:hypothetical protein
MIDERPTFSYYRGSKEPAFATRTELEAAKLFDYHRIAWEYEPRTFILEQDEQGNILEAFTPDFYLPDLELFVEVTEMKQSLVTAKNRKVRKLREQYPDLRIKLLYRKDFVRLAQKYNLNI